MALRFFLLTTTRELVLLMSLVLMSVYGSGVVPEHMNKNKIFANLSPTLCPSLQVLVSRSLFVSV